MTVLLGFGLSFPLKAQDSNCKALLRDGAFDQSDIADDTQLRTKMSQWLCQNRSSTSSSSSSLGVKDLADGFGFDAKRQDWNTWSEAFCQATSASVNYSNVNISRIRSASKILVDGFNSCMAQQNLGVWIGYVPGNAPSNFTLKVGFGPVARKIPTVKIEYQNAVEAGCPVNALPTSLFAGQHRSVACTRKNRKAISIVLNAKDVVTTNDSVDLPEIPTPPDCSKPALQAPGNSLTQVVYAGACDRHVDFVAEAKYKGTCGWSHAYWQVVTLPDGVELKACRDNKFLTTSLNCSGSLNVKKGTVTSLQFRENPKEWNGCADPTGSPQFTVRY